MYYVNRDFFEIIDNEIKAYWLGFLFADGCILEHRNKTTNKLKALKLQLSLASIDGEHIVKFKNDIESEAPISHNKCKVGDKIYYNDKIVICNTKMCRDLINLNCTPRKSLTLEYPVGKLPIEYEQDFIRGYFDGDGSISMSITHYDNKSDVVSLGATILGTDNICDNILNVLNKNDIVAYKHFYDVPPELRIHGKINLLNFYNYIYRNGTAMRYLQRKHDKFIDIFQKLNIGV